MSKLIIMKGLPACGKSTRAEEIMRENGNCIRINKDLLRTMLHFNKFNGVNEGLTGEAARILARSFLDDHRTVIIDDTNLNPRTMQSWKDLAAEEGARVEVIDMTDVDIMTCLLRDSLREKQVGNNVIKNMALQYGLTPAPAKGYVLCDIDGTIADTTHRLHYLQSEKKDWKGFFSQMHLDPVRQSTMQLLIDFYNEGYTIIFMSARPEDYRDVTLKWLADHYLSFAWTLIMRKSGDKRPDTETKKQMLDTYFPDKSLIHAVIDDRPSIIRLWKEEGLNVIDVGQGVEF